MIPRPCRTPSGSTSCRCRSPGPAGSRGRCAPARPAPAAATRRGAAPAHQRSASRPRRRALLIAVEDLRDLVLAGPGQQVQVRQRQPALAQRPPRRGAWRGRGARCGAAPPPPSCGHRCGWPARPVRRRRPIGRPVAGGVPRRHQRHRVPVDQRRELTVRLEPVRQLRAPGDRTGSASKSRSTRAWARPRGSSTRSGGANTRSMVRRPIGHRNSMSG